MIILNSFFLFKVSIPKDCKDSTFCKICKKILGPKAKFRLGATVKKGYYKVSGGFYKIRITGNYYFEKLELFAEVFLIFSRRSSDVTECTDAFCNNCHML